MHVTINRGTVILLRCSWEVKLVTALDVEHEVSSVQVLHYKEEVFLENDKGLALGMGRKNDPEGKVTTEKKRKQEMARG